MGTNVFHFYNFSEEDTFIVPILSRFKLSREGRKSQDLSEDRVKLEPSGLVPELYRFSNWSE